MAQPRKGEPFTLRVDMRREDSEGCVKYVLSWETQESLDEWTALFKPKVKSPRASQLSDSGDDEEEEEEGEEQEEED